MVSYNHRLENMKLLIGTTMVAWKCEKNEHLDWLKNRKEIIKRFPGTKFFASLETDKRGIDPFLDVLRALGEVNGEYWTYQINDHVKKVGSQNRWIRMETGRNLIREFAQRETWLQDASEQHLPPVITYDAIVFIDSDIELTVQMLEAMASAEENIVSLNFPYYGGPSVAGMMIKAPLYFDLPFYHNSYEKINDDFKFQKEAENKFEKVKILDNIVVETLNAKTPVESRQIPDRML